MSCQQPFLVLGDFNAHSGLWGDPRSDAQGRMIEQFLLSAGACLLNKKEPTFFSLVKGGSGSLRPKIAKKIDFLKMLFLDSAATDA